MATKNNKAEQEPTPVTIVPEDNRSEADKAFEKETQKPANVANREGSYELPREGVNLADPE